METGDEGSPLKRWAWAGLAWAGTGLFVATMVASLFLMAKGPEVIFPLIAPSSLIFPLGTVLLGIRVVTDKRLTSRTREAWAWLTLGFTLLLAAILLFTLKWDMFPSPADIVRLSATPILVIGLLRLPMRPVALNRFKIAMDAITGAAAAAAYLWYLQIGPAMTAPGSTTGRILTGTFYPLGDVLLIFGATVVLMRGGEATVRRPLRILTAAILPWIATDVAIGWTKSHPGLNDLVIWNMIILQVVQFLLAAAAYQQAREARRPARSVEARTIVRVSLLPYAAVGAVYGLMIVAAIREHALYPWGGLVICASMVTVVVGYRQIVMQRENHRMAVTDGLTGLANRVRLHEGLALALGRAGRQGEVTGVMLCDLNGFKQVNDTMGHDAGDRLLVAYSTMLRRATLGSDLVARLGGDEFAVILHNIRTPANALAVAQRILDETETPVLIGDTPVRVRGSIGIALALPGDTDGEDLLRRADAAMYDAKRTKAGTYHLHTAETGPISTP